MRFTVVWQPDADEELARIWTEAEDKTTVTVAANELEADLKSRPTTLGEARNANQRIAFAGPLYVQFAVSEDDCLVRVYKVGLLP